VDVKLRNRVQSSVETRDSTKDENKQARDQGAENPYSNLESWRFSCQGANYVSSSSGVLIPPII